MGRGRAGTELEDIGLLLHRCVRAFDLAAFSL